VKEYELWPNRPFWHTGMTTPVGLYGCPSDPHAGAIHWTHQNRLVTITNYLGVNGTNYLTEDGIFYRDSRTRMRDIQDGTSHTLLAGERPPSPDFWYGWWYAGYGQDGTGSVDMLLGVNEIRGDVDYKSYLEDCPAGPYEFQQGDPDRMCSALHFWSHHPGGAHFAFADGSLRFMSYESAPLMGALATIRGGEVVTLD
jgi:prepilin-type processing-associated H-X9-DG protein